MLFFELFSLNLSRLFHCSVIKVLAAFCCRFLLTAVCVSSFIISCVQVFVNNFFKFFIKQGYKDSNLEMTESESVALPFGDSPI